MLLDARNAVIYGGGGSIGGAVARAFAREGARVHLAGRTQATLDAVADQIRSAGGAAETAQVDALDERAVDEHADAVAAAAKDDPTYTPLVKADGTGSTGRRLALVAAIFDPPTRALSRLLFARFLVSRLQQPVRSWPAGDPAGPRPP